VSGLITGVKSFATDEEEDSETTLSSMIDIVLEALLETKTKLSEEELDWLGSEELELDETLLSLLEELSVDSVELDSTTTSKLEEELSELVILDSELLELVSAIFSIELLELFSSITTVSSAYTLYVGTKG